MNPGQVGAAAVAAVLLVVVFACPPYWDDSGLFGSTVYYPFRTPPAEPAVFFDAWLFKWELAYVGITFVSALIALGRNATKGQRVTCAVFLVVEIAFFFSQLPHFATVLGPQFTWYGLNLMAVIGMTILLVMGRVNAETRPGARVSR
jgi:hypothetical protein